MTGIMTKLAIFDLDGTLLDTVKDLGNATNHALTECGFPTHPIEAYYQMVGRGIYNLFRAAVPAGQSTEEVVQRMASIFIPYYDAHKCDFTRPYDGIPGMLKTITAAGVRLADAIAVLRNEYDVIIIDCPPVEIVTDARVINDYVDRTLFVVRAGLFDKAILPDLDALYRDGEYRGLCCVLNGTASSDGYYGNYGTYGHYGYYGHNGGSYYSSDNKAR